MNSNDDGNGKVEILIDQVGHLTESVTELCISVADLRESVTELRISVADLRESVTELRIVTEQQTQAIQAQNELIKRLYDSHDQTINRLVTIVETLIQQH
jgi:uncharacterized protein YoxC